MRITSVLMCLGFLPVIVGATDGGQVEATFPGACPALPDADVIAGLATGQAVTSAQTVTLRFSSKVFTCSNWSNEVSSADCRDWWSFNLTVPVDSISTGVHNLSEIGTAFGDLINYLHPQHGQGCKPDQCDGRTEGIGSVSLLDPAATLEIYAVTDTCITGKLTGLRDPDFKDAPNFNGEFFALRCP